MPGIATETPYYRARWSLSHDKTWQLSLTPRPGNNPSILICSVGPAGGPINHLQWSGNELRINHEWRLSAARPLALTAMGHEGDEGWIKARNASHEWHGADGWGYARLSAASSGPLQLTIRGPVLTKADLPFTSTRSALGMELPDDHFAESLNDQVANLMIRLVRNEPAPASPLIIRSPGCATELIP